MKRILEKLQNKEALYKFNVIKAFRTKLSESEVIIYIYI